MKETMMLRDLEQVKIFAHPLRARLVEVFADQPRTAKQVADLLGLKPTKLYHHVEALERVGLIKFVRFQRKRGTIEKYYRTVARRFSVDSALFQIQGKDKILDQYRAMFATMLDNTMQEINESISEKLICPEKRETGAMLVRKHIRATRDSVKRIEMKIQKLIDELTTTEKGKGDLDYNLTLVFYPLAKKKKRR
ncbi:helix-turn-helix transcriptional regulator [candidate division WOR-3 bacterium]|nr:helix-turn-helix transcriptional regulator [candidate division WOR-3 bacterium]